MEHEVVQDARLLLYEDVNGLAGLGEGKGAADDLGGRDGGDGDAHAAGALPLALALVGALLGIEAPLDEVTLQRTVGEAWSETDRNRQTQSEAFSQAW